MLKKLGSTALAVALFVPAIFAQEPDATEANAAPAAKSPEAKANEKLAKQLFNRAYATGKDLSEADRAFLSARLAEAWAEKDKNKATTFADEAFSLSAGLKDMQLSEPRTTAMLALAKVNPEHALELLGRMEAPPPRDDGSPRRDPRQAAATMLFQNYFRSAGMDALPAIEAAARNLGESGAYPFMAMGMLIRGVEKKDHDRAQSLMNQALMYINKRQQSTMAVQELGMFLNANRSLIPKPVLREVLERLVNEALQNDDPTVSASIANEKGVTANFKGLRAFTLMQLMPMVRDIDPEWAKKLEQEHSDLQNAANLMPAGDGGQRTFMSVSMGGPNNNSNPNMGNMLMQEMKSREVDELIAANDTEGALKQADSITDPALRAASTAKLAGSLNKSDPERAAEILKNAKAALGEAKTDADRLRILVGLTYAQQAMGDSNAFRDSLAKAYALCDELFRKSVNNNPQMPVFARPGFESLGQLLRLEMKDDRQAAIARIEELRSPLLQAHMYIEAAETILDPNAPPHRPGMRIVIGS